MANSSHYKNVTHVLFDLDGLILDTEKLYTEMTNNIVSKYGKTFEWETKVQLMGLTGADAAKKIIKLLDLPITWVEYFDQIALQNELMMPDAQFMPGAEELIRHLHKHSIPIAVATSSSERSANLKFTNHMEVFGLFNHIVAGGSDPDVKKGKPNPDIFLVCASRFLDKPRPENCLVFEDAPNGVEAAVAAGMQCVMVPDERISIEQTKLATQVLRSLKDLKLEDFGLPPLN